MPRPVKARRSLPSHSKAPTKLTTTRELNNEDFEMEMDGNAQGGPSSEPIEEAAVELPRATKQKKSDKIYEKQKKMLAKITDGVSPYSKSHNRRIKKQARPDQHLVTNLAEVDNVLEQMSAAVEVEAEENEDVEEVLAGGKGKEKLTAKKRNRVLIEEASRLPSIISNPAFASKPWETIRLHTLNTMESTKSQPKQKQKPQQKKLK